MEAHPIPQNITSFQFKLVGDMTLKQFMYLAAGLGSAYLIFITLAAQFPILAWPLIVVFSISGVAFAFLPFQDRPLDHWLKAFLRSVYTPTKRVWEKNGHIFSEEPLFNSRLNTFLTNQGAQVNIPHISLPTNPTSIPIQTTPPQATKPAAPTPMPTPEQLSETVKLAREAQNLQQQIIQTEHDLAQIKVDSATPGANTAAYTERLNALLGNLQRLVRETTDVRSQLTKDEPKGVTRTIKVEVINPAPRPKVQLVLTSLPNVINGIVIDSAGNYLTDVVVVVRDKDGLPVRALKTNKLGQFTGATPLPNGTYTVEMEKESFVFDILKIELDGKLLPAISIAAKKLAGNS